MRRTTAIPTRANRCGAPRGTLYRASLVGLVGLVEGAVAALRSRDGSAGFPGLLALVHDRLRAEDLEGE